MKNISRRQFLKLSAAAAAAGALASQGIAVLADEEDHPALSEYPLAPDAEGTEAKYTVEETADGWVKVINEDGPVIGYSKDSGVQIIQVDGYAFKDTCGSGMLEICNDWRVSAEDRARDLAARIEDPTFMLNMKLHPSLGTIESDGSTAVIDNNPIEDYLDAGLRTALNGSVGRFPAKDLSVFNNNIQAYVEGSAFGIPFNFSSNPNTLGFARSLSMASSFDPEYVGGIYQLQAKMYRSIGITTLLGPQIDLTTEPRWNRIRDTFGEDPALSRDMTNAAFNGMQSTFSESGEDLGWGADSVAAMMKHWPGDGSGESGRESHSASGKYTVYPGGGFDTILIPFVDGALNLSGKTEKSCGVMMSYSIAYSDTEEYGELVASPYSAFKMALVRSYSPDILVCTDWGSASNRAWGISDDVTEAEKFAWLYENSVDQVGGMSSFDQEGTMEILNTDLGEEDTIALLQDSVYRILLPMFKQGLFENPYTDSQAASELWNSQEVTDFMTETKVNSIIMLKNKGQVIAPASGETEKKTVYVPRTWFDGVGGTPMENGDPEWRLPVDLAVLSAKYNVVTDTVGEPSGEDGGYTENDIIRASAEELAACDMAICFTDGPKNAGSEGKGYGHDSETGEYFPISLQYGEYIADSDYVRAESISGDQIETVKNDGYADVTFIEKENCSYFGKAARVSNSSDLDGILYAKANLPEGAPVIVCINSIRPIIVSEFEQDADAILIGFSVDYANFLEVIEGNVEPTSLLPLQMPASMEAVEAQLEDIPRDCECYTDSEGNTYDFAFGMNWDGVIDDERVATYYVEPLTAPENQPE